MAAAEAFARGHTVMTVRGPEENPLSGQLSTTWHAIMTHTGDDLKEPILLQSSYKVY